MTDSTSLLWIPEYIVDYSKSTEKFISIDDSHWIPIKFIPDINELNYNFVTIRFISGLVLVIQIDYNEKLINLKKWIIDCLEYYNDDIYDLVFIIDTEPITNTIGITLNNINDITCCILQKNENIMISADCTASWHISNLSQSWNTLCMGDGCCKGCGLLIPRGLNIKNLPENIPEEYINKFNDIDWIIFKKKIANALDKYSKYSNMSYEDKKRIKNSIKNEFTGLCKDDYEMTIEESEFLFYIELHFCRY
jgi:hypothetical protein